MKRALPAALPGPVLIRGVLLVAGVALMLTPVRPNVLTLVLAAAGLVGVLVRPDRTGAGPVTLAFVITWIVADDWHADPSLVRVAIAAAALYLLHAGAALAAVVPLGARLDRAVGIRFVRRSALVLGAAAALIAADYAIGSRRGSPVIELLGLLAALALVAVPLGRALR
ncbi:MAG TPA: hypothetical protein VGN18_02645 [Jatrophihabitans sp.]|uniref:hypothetical protein n=1 Tax=Jatrophihabitans sp. TaxID=1932789 RepID=UPI002DF75520|nr:hypothetical protein [Jatrophihabitans sp.]